MTTTLIPQDLSSGATATEWVVSTLRACGFQTDEEPFLLLANDLIAAIAEYRDVLRESPGSIYQLEIDLDALRVARTHRGDPVADSRSLVFEKCGEMLKYRGWIDRGATIDDPAAYEFEKPPPSFEFREDQKMSSIRRSE